MENLITLLALKYEYRQIIVPASMLLPLIAGAILYKKLSISAKWMLIYLAVSIITNAIVIIYTIYQKNNYPLLHVYTVLESFLLLNYFGQIILYKRIQALIKILKWIFPLYCIFNSLFLQSINSFNSYARPPEAIIFITLCGIYWWQENEADSELAWANIPNNWFVTGLMLYFAGAFFLFLLGKFIMTGVANKNAWNLVWDTHATLVLIMYLLTAVGFIKCKK